MFLKHIASVCFRNKQQRASTMKTQNFKLMYLHGGRWLERIYKDTIYANVQRVANSFPKSVTWYIEPM
nr:hypothetical protein [Vibrio sp. 04Ya090]